MTLSKSPFFNGDDATISITRLVVAPLTKLSGEIAALVRAFTVFIVTVTPLVIPSML